MSNNVHNLVQTLSTKLDSVTRYRIYIEDAEREGEQECVDLFRRLEEQDTQAVRELQQHLSTRIGSSSSQRGSSSYGSRPGESDISQAA